jgi:glycosyltransferase involved in cell wall biosynthesis
MHQCYFSSRMELISIIIPTYNRAGMIGATLDSVIAQTYTNWECIVVDDGSTDDSVEVLKSYEAKDKRIRCFSGLQKYEKGANSCRNYGFEQSVGEFVQFFDSDDLMLPIMLQKKVEAIRAYPQVDFIVSKMSEQTAAEMVYPQYDMDSNNRIYDYLAYKIYFLTPGPLFRKSFLMGKKLFTPGLRRYQEWEFYSRLVVNGCNYRVVDEYHCIRTMHDDSIRNVYETRFGYLTRYYLKMIAVRSVNNGTRNKAIGQLDDIFGRRVLSLAKQSLITYKLGYFWFFAILYFELKIKLALYKPRK